MDQKQLAAEYPALQVYSANNNIGHGNRVVYWVGSDGRRAIVFNCLGDRFIVTTDELRISDVVNVAAYSLEGGRLRFQKTPESAWIDAGPLCESAVKSDDPGLDTIKKRIGKNLSFDELVESEEEDGSNVWESDGW